ncbi:FAD-binding oxidoreductase [Jiangella sp. DSM 45060]|uniref:FAD-binding oxidoreductase n=1 Tax=Jiangella sp. DSM 45060 TaxID=1798224 RepID=UPI00087B0ED8|nr:FAD-binding oxidoreductase [Jiangella sp. DSM 45060]SDT00673.1 FAD/FMN-containing dehydrogenase [Jiangella sp. DSM 45060]
MIDLDGFRSTLTGRAYAPGDDGYDDVRQPWNLAIDQHPAVVVVAETAADVQAAVRLARENGVSFSVQSSGHGAVRPNDDGVVLNVTRLTGVDVDAERKVARIDAGARWRGVLEAAAPHQLAGLSGTAPTVGAVGYTLGGGIGLLMRRFGFAADTVVGADVVTADGSLVRASHDENPDLLWALKGGGGNFGVVTSLEVQLYDLPAVHNGSLLYPGARAAEVLRAWADWTGQVSDDVTSAVMVMTFPPIPAVPEPLRGQHVAALRATIAGDDGSALEPLRAALGDPLMGGFRTQTYLEAALSGSEPTDPMPTAGRSTGVAGLTDAAIDGLLELVAPGSPVPGVDIRHLGGAAAKEQDGPLSHRDTPYIAAANALAATPEQRAAVQQRLDDGFGALAAHTRPVGVLNFLPSGSTPEIVRSAFSDGAWQRLQEVKRTWDPENVFRFTQNIPPAG